MAFIMKIRKHRREGLANGGRNGERGISKYKICSTDKWTLSGLVEPFRLLNEHTDGY